MKARHRPARRWWWQRKPKPPRLYPLVETWEACRTNYRR